MPGAADVVAERVTGGEYLDINMDREAAARYGLKVGDIQEIIETAIGGMDVTKTVEGRDRFPVLVRYVRDFRDNLAVLDGCRCLWTRGRRIYRWRSSLP